MPSRREHVPRNRHSRGTQEPAQRHRDHHHRPRDGSARRESTAGTPSEYRPLTPHANMDAFTAVGWRAPSGPPMLCRVAFVAYATDSGAARPRCQSVRPQRDAAARSSMHTIVSRETSTLSHGGLGATHAAQYAVTASQRTIHGVARPAAPISRRLCATSHAAQSYRTVPPNRTVLEAAGRSRFSSSHPRIHAIARTRLNGAECDP